jgi:hypothetical protein
VSRASRCNWSFRLRSVVRVAKCKLKYSLEKISSSWHPVVPLCTRPQFFRQESSTFLPSISLFCSSSLSEVSQQPKMSVYILRNSLVSRGNNLALLTACAIACFNYRAKEESWEMKSWELSPGPESRDYTISMKPTSVSLVLKIEK